MTKQRYGRRKKGYRKAATALCYEGQLLLDSLLGRISLDDLVDDSIGVGALVLDAAAITVTVVQLLHLLHHCRVVPLVDTL